MAQYDHTAEVTALINAGMSLDEISAARREIDIDTYKDGSWEAITWNRADQRSFDAWAEQKLRQLKAGTTEPLATERQVDYIMSLLAQTDGQNVSWFSPAPTEYAEIAKMTRKDASTYISALKGTY
ncbi:hypothetical protein QP968_00815 [Corynebacterium sp. MSK041]|uniref:hypothetical protein n=1 Tax=Corynebacterium sp. MSK041 TaxID=3050194 RepID=UPI00254D7ECB|nr:hypothetical protein [Corynebacterium sp. MSK041]MDK8794255.1 hypothetical protein [Corynebacterium sp. MSK041]